MLRVVLVDDEEPVRAILGITLGMSNDFRVVGEAANGRDAITVVDEQHPDAVVLDLMMPSTGGMETIPELRRCSPETKIVVFSALSEGEAADQAVACGADAYIQKARVMSLLPDTIHRLCDC
ncbi:MAG TPA: response regulator transcription factor [Acidimicrobiales bacterium]|nr:response regulator transcription factor [Acidimicrobiales bacterium]